MLQELQALGQPPDEVMAQALGGRAQAGARGVGAPPVEWSGATEKPQRLGQKCRGRCAASNMGV